MIDYKTGTNAHVEAHKKQIDNYANILKMMGYEDVSKFIIYTEQSEKILAW